jgi:hypothetical protein
MTPTDLTYAIEKLNFIPIRPDGAPFIVNFLTDEGGYLLDGAPMNVWFDGVWYEGQKEVGNKYWGKNGVPMPSSQILSLPVVPMPGDIAETYQAFKASQGGLFSGNTLVYVGLGLLALYAFTRAPGRGSRSWSDDY